MAKNDYLGRPEFWLDYCETEADAECVAKMFPQYWNQFYADFLAKYHGEMVDTQVEAFAWTRKNLATAIRSLRRLQGRPNPLLSLQTDVPDEQTELGARVKAIQHEKRVVELAQEYITFARPKPVIVRPRTREGYTVVSGERVAIQERVENLSHKLGAAGQGLRWGPALLPRERGRLSNFCVVGMPRSGKTTLLRLLAQSTLWRQKKCRLIIYDEKTGAPAAVFCNEAELSAHGCLFNPFDARSTPWDIAGDARSPHQANEIARTLIPEMSGRENPFFVAAARAVLAAAMVSLNATRGINWNLMDLLLAVSSQYLKSTLLESAQGKEVLDTYFSDNNASSTDLKKTLATVLHPLVPVAAAWDRDSREKVSIRKWAIEGEGVLMLGNLNAYSAAMRALNRTVLNILIEALLDLTSEQVKETYVFLDEFQSLGYIDNLTTLLRTGPGLGVTTVLGVHDLGLLKETYGQHAEGVLSMCGHFALLRTNSRETAKWASDLLGEQTIRLRKQSVTEQAADEPDQPPRLSTTTSEHDVTRPLVHPDEFFGLPLTSDTEGLTGYYKSPLHPVYKGHLNGKELFFTTNIAADENLPDDYRLFQNEALVKDFDPRRDDELVPRESLHELEQIEEDKWDEAAKKLPSPLDPEAYNILRVRRLSMKDYSDAHSSG